MKLRCYTVVNQYIAGIHAGIQSAHAIAEMMHNVGRHPLEKELVDQWAGVDKTIIVLDGGYQSNLEKIYAVWMENAAKLNLPFAKFHEEKEALNGALTALAIILPEKIFSAKEGFTGKEWYYFDGKNPENGVVYLEDEECFVKESIYNLRLKGS